jgi:3-oxoacyl-[acyl-carrier protein] reductase
MALPAAIVTGSAGGIGAAIAERLADAGLVVSIADTEAEAAEQETKHVASTASSTVAYRANVSDSVSARKMIDATLERF